MTPLPPDRWPEIERLFTAAVGRPDDVVEAVLAAAEPAVSAEVRALLDADRAAGDEPAGPPAGLGTLLADLTLFVGRDASPGDGPTAASRTTSSAGSLCGPRAGSA